MTLKQQESMKDAADDLSLLIASAEDIVAELSDLAAAVERGISKNTDVDTVVSLLKRKKAKVDTLNVVALEITSRLNSASHGGDGLTLPEGLKSRFRELMANFRQLLEKESRVEDLIAGRGFPVSRRLR